jgi:hypothetical protein
VTTALQKEKDSMVRWLLSAALPVADRVIARLCRSKKILKIYDTAFDALVQLNAIPA